MSAAPSPLSITSTPHGVYASPVNSPSAGGSGGGGGGSGSFAIEPILEPIVFSTPADTKSAIQNEKDVLCVVGYGVDYIYPSRKSLEYLHRWYRKENSNPPGLVKVFIIDEEKNRKFCDDNGIVVGTPVLQFFFNGRSLKFRYTSKDPVLSAQQNSKNSSIFVGQYHDETVKALIEAALTAIKEQQRDGDKSVIVGDIFVDVDLDRLRDAYFPVRDTSTISGELGSSMDDSTDSEENTEEDMYQ